MTLSSNSAKMRSRDRILVLEPGEAGGRGAAGLIDKRLFSGENNLHAIQNEQSLWYLKYAHGNIPEPLKQKFTSFSKLMKHATDYFGKRNVIVKEVKD